MKNIARLFVFLVSIFLIFITCSKDDSPEPTPTPTPKVTYTLSTTASPTDGGTVSPASGTFEKGETVTFTATPNTNFEFKNWSGGVTGTDNPITVTIDSNKSITAAFEKKDTDGDSIMDDVDQCPNTPNGETVDANGCSDSEKDTDGDTIMDNVDLCPNTPSGETVDETGCSESQKDDDGDGVMNDKDTCSETPSGEIVDDTGCSESQKDDDEDGIMNDKDICSDTPSGETVDDTGCSESQKDDDGDGIMNDKDNCSDTPSGEAVDDTGCSESQKDDDGDGIMNDKDSCMDTPSGEAVDDTGCSESQKDDDEDGVMNDKDNCPNTPSGGIVDNTGCIPDPKWLVEDTAVIHNLVGVSTSDTPPTVFYVRFEKPSSWNACKITKVRMGIENSYGRTFEIVAFDNTQMLSGQPFPKGPMDIIKTSNLETPILGGWRDFSVSKTIESNYFYVGLRVKALFDARIVYNMAESSNYNTSGIYQADDQVVRVDNVNFFIRVYVEYNQGYSSKAEWIDVNFNSKREARSISEDEMIKGDFRFKN